MAASSSAATFYWPRRHYPRRRTAPTAPAACNPSRMTRWGSKPGTRWSAATNRRTPSSPARLSKKATSSGEAALTACRQCQCSTVLLWVATSSASALCVCSSASSARQHCCTLAVPIQLHLGILLPSESATLLLTARFSMAWVLCLLPIPYARKRTIYADISHCSITRIILEASLPHSTIATSPKSGRVCRLRYGLAGALGPQTTERRTQAPSEYRRRDVGAFRPEFPRAEAWER
jgi:hypothetical protein